MDRLINKKKHKIRQLSVGTIVIIGLVYLVFTPTTDSIDVKKHQLIISKVRKQVFSEYLPFIGQIIPTNTYYLDAVAGGQVEAIYCESGDSLKKGDPIIKLANTQLLLQVMRSEAELYRQEDQLRNTILNLGNNRLRLEEKLADIDYRVGQAQRELRTNERLFKNSLISKDDYDDSQQKYQLEVKNRQLTETLLKNENIFRSEQIKEAKNAVKRMRLNLSITQEILEKLTVRAEVDGQISGLNLEVGQSIQQGQRIGQIDDISGFKLTSNIDQHYISQIKSGTRAEMSYLNKSVQLKITRISPDVINGVVKVEFAFINELKQIRRGQQFEVRVIVSEQEEKLVIDNGGFYSNSFDGWLFVLNDNNLAEKRFVTIGKRNPKFIEVKNNLIEGEQVIVSNYQHFKHADILNLID